MNKNLKIVLTSIVVIVVVIIGVNVYAAVTSNVELIAASEPLAADDFEITVDDAYNAEFTKIPILDYAFDKYLAIDLTIKNISDHEQKFIAIKKFFLDDGTNNARHFLIDENQKKYWTTLDADETFDITLVFPVDNATEYTLFYNKSLKAKDDKQVGFTIDGTDLKTKKVEQVAEHTELNKDTTDESTTNNEDSQKETNA
ncbi:MAG: DUF4352 domain-containing protein [Mycoplasmatales bacterium]